MSEKPAVSVADRPTARVVLLDRAGRILLMKGRLPGNPDNPAFWFTIGGSVEAGETYMEAAAREIREETGITQFELGPVVWLREGVLGLPHPVRMVEQYILAWCDEAEPDRAGWDALERELIDDIRWWTLEDLHATTDGVFPPGLAGLLAELVDGDVPEAPRAIPWA
jgi:8-oxo-dGTP pyrophosphatase MutT (NUDIX family)